jgi:hypothetical protein
VVIDLAVRAGDVQESVLGAAVRWASVVTGAIEEYTKNNRGIHWRKNKEWEVLMMKVTIHSCGGQVQTYYRYAQ